MFWQGIVSAITAIGVFPNTPKKLSQTKYSRAAKHMKVTLLFSICYKCEIFFRECKQTIKQYFSDIPPNYYDISKMVAIYRETSTWVKN